MIYLFQVPYVIEAETGSWNSLQTRVLRRERGRWPYKASVAAAQGYPPPPSQCGAAREVAIDRYCETQSLGAGPSIGRPRGG